MKEPHVPQVVVPVRPDEIVEFITNAMRPMRPLGMGRIVRLTRAGGVVIDDRWIYLQLTFTPVDESTTRIEVEAKHQGFWQLRFGGIHRFFVAIEDELDRLGRGRG